MTIARALRILLAFAAALVVAWGFFDVVHRAIVKRSQDHERPITLTILHWGDRAEDVIVQNLADRYMADHPNVKIIRINPAYGNFRPKLKTMMAAGTPPDLFYLPPDLFPELASQNLIRPIDDYIAKERASGNGEYLDDFFPILMKAWKYDTATGIIGQGKMYGLPKDFTTSVMFVNLDLFAKAGVPVPYDGWTWDEFAADMKKIRNLSGTAVANGKQVYGADLELWSDSLRNILWSYGGDYFHTSEDGTTDFSKTVIGSPESLAAMDMIRRLRLEEKTVFNVTGGVDNNDVGFQQFLAGNIGCDGPVGHWKIPLLSGDVKFKWDCVPVPHAQGKPAASAIYLTAWTMANTTKYPEECFSLMKFLCSSDGALMQAQAGLAIPPLMSVAASKDYLEAPGIPKHHEQIFVDSVKAAHIPQSPRDYDFWSRLIDTESARCLQLGTATTTEVAAAVDSQWRANLNSPLNRYEWKPVRWDMIVSVTAAAFVTVVFVLWTRARKEKLGPLDRAQQRAGFAFIMPWLLGFVTLTLGPMLVSLMLSFTKWSAMSPMSGALSVGTANYEQLLTNDPIFRKSLKVTIYYVLLAVPVGQIAALAVALLMNVKVRGIAWFRTIYFVPSVISGVTLATLWRQIFNNEYGLMNKILNLFLHPVGLSAPDWFGVDAQYWAVPAFVVMALWGVGGGMILYLAGLKGIPASLYEAARIDGASVLRRFWNVTLPMLSPLIFYNVIMGIIGSFQIFVQAVVMTDGGPNNNTFFYVFNLYRQAFEYHKMGYASAMAWILFLMILVLTILIFRGSRNLVYYEGLKT